MGIIYNIVQKGQYFIGIILFLVLLIPLAVWGKQPIGLKKWRINDTTFVKNIGGSVRNYKKADKTWDSIVNIFEIEGDSVAFVNKSVLKARISKNGTSTVSLMWNDITYTVTQKMLGIGWIKISTRQSQWIDSTMNWGNFSVDSNICKWTGVSPGVDYGARKSNGQLEHGLFLKPAFLDSAVILYNQRPDSLDIALANVMVYTLSSNIDDADSAIGDVPWRRLKDLGYYSFNLTRQRLRFPGCDTLPRIPVRQYWERRGTKIVCVEYVMMRWVKQVHETYPGAVIWHNDTKVIEGTTNVEDAMLSAGLPDRDYGGAAYVMLLPNASGLIRVKNVASELGAGATISSCICSVYIFINTTNDAGVGAFSVFKPWKEGVGNGVNCADPGCSWEDWSCDTYEWTTEGCECARDGGVDNSYDGGVCNQDVRADRKATEESSTAITEVGWTGFSVTASLAQSWYNATKNEEGILLKGDGTGSNRFRSTEYTSEQPFWVFTYTTEAVGVGQVIHINQ